MNISEQLVYGIILTICELNNNTASLSLKYFQDLTKLRRNSVVAIIKNLEKKELIVVKRNAFKVSSYSINTLKIPSSENELVQKLNQLENRTSSSSKNELGLVQKSNYFDNKEKRNKKETINKDIKEYKELLNMPYNDNDTYSYSDNEVEDDELKDEDLPF